MADEITTKEEIPVETPIEPIPEPAQAQEPQTAQIPVSEPLTTPTETPSEPEVETITETIQIEPDETEIQSEPVSETISEPVPQITLEPNEEVKPEIAEVKSEPEQEIQKDQKPEPKQSKPIPIIIPSKSLARELLVKARNMIQFRKRKKLDKIMTLFEKQTKITNDQVEKFMHVSDATATRYLSQLEKEGKIKQTGKTGKSVFYTKI